MISGLVLIEKEICEQITEHLDKVGILYRIFSRRKDNLSIEDKITRKETDKVPYQIGGKLMQDVIGVRIVTYFKDDIDIVYSILKSKLHFLNEQIDPIKLTVFEPKRTNIICKLNKHHCDIFKDVQEISDKEYFKLVDNTFELQLRTILSEGWHEIDHSLRYKCKKDWVKHAENERMLNGIYASLETNDIALKSLFEELAYKHYKDKNWEGLLRNKFRIKFQQNSLDVSIINILNTTPNIGKQIFRLERKRIIDAISQLEFSLPISFNNIMYLINTLILKNEGIYKLTPQVLLNEIKNVPYID